MNSGYQGLTREERELLDQIFENPRTGRRPHAESGRQAQGRHEEYTGITGEPRPVPRP